MSLATNSSLSPSLPDAMMQVAMESEQNISVSCSNGLLLAFADNSQIQDSDSGLFAYAQNTIITGGTFVVCLSCRLYKQLLIVHILSEQCQYLSL